MCVRVRVVYAPWPRAPSPPDMTMPDTFWMFQCLVLHLFASFIFVFCCYLLLVCLSVDSAEVSTNKPLIGTASWSTNSVCHVTVSHASAACLKFYSWSRDEKEKLVQLLTVLSQAWQRDFFFSFLYSSSLYCIWSTCGLCFLWELTWPHISCYF